MVNLNVLIFLVILIIFVLFIEIMGWIIGVEVILLIVIIFWSVCEVICFNDLLLIMIKFLCILWIVFVKCNIKCCVIVIK